MAKFADLQKTTFGKVKRSSPFWVAAKSTPASMGDLEGPFTKDRVYARRLGVTDVDQNAKLFCGIASDGSLKQFKDGSPVMAEKESIIG